MTGDLICSLSRTALVERVDLADRSVNRHDAAHPFGRCSLSPMFAMQ